MRKILALAAATTASIFAQPISVDLSDATATLQNVGTAVLGLVVLGVGFSIAMRFTKKGGNA